MPWRRSRPRRTLVPRHVQGVDHRSVVADFSAPFPCWLMPRAIHLPPLVTANWLQFRRVALARVPIWLANCRHNLCEAAVYIERPPLLQYVDSRPLRACVPRPWSRLFGWFSLSSARRSAWLPDSEVRRLNEGPGQILVPVLAVAFTLFLKIAFVHAVHAVHAASIGGVVANASKAFDRASFEKDRGGQDPADT